MSKEAALIDFVEALIPSDDHFNVAARLFLKKHLETALQEICGASTDDIAAGSKLGLREAATVKAVLERNLTG